MGGIVSLIQSTLDALAHKERRVLMLGLDNAGKTTTLYRLQLGEVVSTIPTIGFNVETVRYRRLELTVWDIGGQTKLRPLWRHYYANTHVLMFVIDSADARIDEAREELHRLLSEDDLRGAHVLILANKQDDPRAMSVEEVTRRLAMPAVYGRRWMVQGCCAITGQGLHEALEWMRSALDA